MHEGQSNAQPEQRSGRNRYVASRHRLSSRCSAVPESVASTIASSRC
jgi:hypothetical protein